jgi:hypothetical protein
MTAEAAPTSDDASLPPLASPPPVGSSTPSELSELSELLPFVPHDPWYRVRVVAMGACTVAYLWWSRVHGLVTDRISAGVAVGVFLVCAFAGKPWRRWGQVAGDAVCYAGMWFAYESTRGAADGLGMPLQLDAVRTIDRILFLGAQPTEWVQRHWYEAGEVRWHDHVLSLVYYSHFVVPVMAVAAVWAVSRTMWVRYMRRFATVVVTGCVMFVLLPTVPPWMASDERFGYGVGEPLVRHVRRGVLDLGFTGFVHDWKVALDWSNVVAAMPSLHAAFSLFVVVFFLPMVRRGWRFLLFAYPLAMAFALVYFAEHWVIDVLVGWALVAASFAAWHHIERAARTRDVASACAASVVPDLADRAVGDGDGGDGPAGPFLAPRDPAVVLLDRSMLDALVQGAPGGTDADRAAIEAYTRLLARHLDGTVRLVARADHLATFDLRARRGVLAPVRPVAVAAQYRRQAERLARLDRFAPLAGRPDDLLTLVVARRARAGAIETAA